MQHTTLLLVEIEKMPGLVASRDVTCVFAPNEVEPPPLG